MPIIIAYAVYLYNYKEILNIKNRILTVKLSVMDEDLWIVKEFRDVRKEISDLSNRMVKLETRNKIYAGLTIVLTPFAVKLLDFILKN